MIKELTDKLHADFPNLYKSHDYWGFACGDGWYPLIRRLSEKLEALGGCVASQTKEKFGSLRFYVDDSTDEADALIREAEAESAVTCEYCGAPGTMGGKGWIRCLCEACR